MKKIIASLLILIIHLSVLGNTGGEITVGYNNKKSTLEVKVVTELKTGTEAKFTIQDQKGKTVFTKTTNLAEGENIIPLEEITKLTEGTYTLKMVANKKIQSTKFTVWK
jgi:hypothetical protein